MLRTIITNVIGGLAMASVSFCNNDVQAVDNSNAAFEYREIYLPEGIGRDARAMGLNSVDIDWGLWGHNLSSVLPEKPSQTIYAKQSGQTVHEQFCFSSEKLFEYIVKFIEKDYDDDDTERFAILPNDNGYVCTCTDCRKLGNTDHDASPAVQNMICRLAARFPNHLFFTSYYNTTRSLPTEQLPDNAGVLISAMDYPHTAVTTTQEMNFEELLTAWAQKTNRVYVWDYVNNFDDYFTPNPMFEVMQRRLQMYARVGVKGVFLNGSGTDYSSLSDVKTRILAELTKDPDTDWRTLLPKVCSELYPTTGETIANFILKQEDYVVERGKTLPLYEGVATALQTYLPEAEFLDFCKELNSVRKKAKGDEADKVRKLANAMTLTQLEINRLKGDVSGSKELLAGLNELIGDGVEVYSETCWTLSGYITDYNFMYSHAETAGKDNLLKGAKITALTALDEDYTDLSILTDGLLGLPANYHCGQMQSSADPALKLSIPRVPGMKSLRICLTRNPIYHISLPIRVSLYINDEKIQSVEPQKSAVHPGHAFVDFELPTSISGNLVVTLTKNPEAHTLAIDEIEGY